MVTFRIRLVLSLAVGVLFASPASAAVTPQSGWWWDPALSGTGWFIEYNSASNSLFMAQFLYNSSGNATWLVSTGSYDQTNSTYTNNWLQVSGGQELTGSYRQPSSNAGAGAFSITFQTATSGTMTRPDGSKITIQRFSFTSSPTPAAPQAGAPQTGWWWADPAGPYINTQYGSGTGYGMEFQGSSVFLVAYAYDVDGNPVWYLATGSATSPTSYSGTWDVYTGGPQLTTPEGAVTNFRKFGSATTMTLTFTDSAHAVLAMGTNPEIDIPLIRFFNAPSAIVQSLTINPTSGSLTTGQTATYTAAANLSDGTKIDISKVAAWTTGSTSIATVSKGVATGTGSGQTSVTATYNKLSASATLTVSGTTYSCALMNSTAATSTVTSGCTLLSRDTSSCLASRMAQGLSGAWLKFSCRVTLLKTTVNGQSVVQVSADSQPDYKSNYFATSDACYTAYKTPFPDPNLIVAQKFVINVPVTPNTQTQAMSLGTVGLGVNGVALFSNKAAPGDDIYQESGSFDQCQGHPQQTGVYHYHSEPYAISVNDSGLIGVLRDGYFLYGRKDADGSTPQLDAAGGHTGTTADSPTAPVYHYHVNLQTSTTSGTAGQSVWFLTTGTYKGSPGTCNGGC